MERREEFSPTGTSPVVAVCGGTGSGKTYLVNEIQDRCNAEGLTMAAVSFDSYYHDLAHLTQAERAAANFDHPDSLDGALFAAHIHQLAAGNTVEVPLYDFSTHSRTGETETVAPADVVVLDGILLFAFEAVRNVIDLAVYLDVPADLRLDRRVARDTVERGRDVADVERQWREFVEPMHDQYVEPFAGAADIVAKWGEEREALLDLLMDRIGDLRARSSAPKAAEANS